MKERPLTARRALWIVVCYFIMQVIGGAVVGFVIGLWLAIRKRRLHPSVGASTVGAIAVVPATFGAMLLGGTVAFRMTKRSFSHATYEDFRQSVGWRKASRPWLFAAALVGIGLSAMYLRVLLALLPPAPGQSFGPLATAAASSGWSRHAWAVLALFVVPPIEEFVFRGAVFSGLSRSWGIPKAFCATTILFSLSHVSSFHPYLPALCMVTVVGALQLWARIVSGSLLPAIAIHAGYNAALVVALYSGAG
jgi:uncharacterized protein